MLCPPPPLGPPRFAGFPIPNERGATVLAIRARFLHYPSARAATNAARVPVKKQVGQVRAPKGGWTGERGGFYSWLPDSYSQIFRSYVFGPSGFWAMAPLRCAAKFDPFLSLDCAPTPSTLTQSKERKGSNFAIWQPWAGF